MAARKLKFKPKPLVVGGAVRKARGRDDVPELTSKEPNSSEKGTMFTNEKCIEELSVVCKSENFVDLTKEDTVMSEENALKRLKTEHSASESAPLSLSDGLMEQIRPSVVNFNLNASPNNDFSVCNSLNTAEENIPLNITKQECISSVEHEGKSLSSSNCSVINVVESLCCKENATDVTMADESPTKDFAVCNECLSKPEIAKAFPRFGRSRCKPILTNPGLRKRNDDSVKSDISDMASVRTESVIKIAKSELSKAKAIVAEITESFSLLESDEPELLCTKAYVREKRIAPFEVSSSDNQSELSLGVKRVKSNDDHPSNVSESFVETKEIPTPKTELNLSVSTSQTRVIVNKLYESGNFNHISKKEEQSNEIKAEVLNTTNSTKVPISPLRTTSKILVPKPSPRLADIIPRRVSFQGSDSEDEAKRKYCLLKNDVLKSVNKGKKEKDLKNKKRKRSQGSTYSKMGQEALEKFTKKFGNEQPDKTKLTMLDFIFYNPKSNPMSLHPQQARFVQKKEEKMEVSEPVEEALADQSVDDVEPAAAMPVPQLKVGPDGQVMLDPKSLVIETTGMEKSRAELENSQVIQETGITRYSTYSKKKYQRKSWSTKDTLQFYKVLNTIGSDFTLMAQFFPKRTRYDLKLKFKREEKMNMHLVDKAMTASSHFDLSCLEEELRRENEEIERVALENKLIKEDQMKKRAHKREEKCKKKTVGVFKGKKGSSFAELDETDTGKQYFPKKKSKNRRSKNTRGKKADYKMIDSDLEDELQHGWKMDLDASSPDDDEGLILLKMVKENRTGRRILKPTAKLEEYEEINETLKHKLCHESDSEDDLYTPNGLGAHMLFGSPLKGPSHEANEGQWNIEITSLPTIEETVLMHDNVENVSEISELGSFGQNDTALDLSMPIRGNIQRELLEEGQDDNSVLNRRIISQSIQIIDQLTSNVDSSSMYVEEEVDNDILEEIVTTKEHHESTIPLPSFESVRCSRPSMVYPLQLPFIPADSDHENEASVSTNAPHIVLANYYDGDEECILGE